MSYRSGFATSIGVLVYSVRLLLAVSNPVGSIFLANCKVIGSPTFGRRLLVMLKYPRQEVWGAWRQEELSARGAGSFNSAGRLR